MSNFQLLLNGLDTSKLKAYLEANPELWQLLTVRQDSTPFHKDTEAIFLRGPKTLDVQEYMHGLDAVDYPLPPELLSLCAHLLTPVLDVIQARKLGKAMIVKLKAGKEVLSHVDQGLYAKAYSRFHVAIDTCEGNLLVCEDQLEYFEEGQAWWFNHRKEHSALNRSDKDRIHIIFDAESPLFQVDQEGL